MKTHRLHSWDVSVDQARAIQKNLRAWIITEGKCRRPRMMARIELACAQEGRDSLTVQACVSIKSLPGLQLLERKVSVRTSSFPDEPGLASFRKVPAIVAALEKLVRVPDVILCDGRGITGDDSFGVASHVGLITNLPTMGVSPAKPRQMTELLGQKRGSWIPLQDGGGHAALVRVLEGQDPLIVSPAHKLGMEDAVQQMLLYVPENTPSWEYQQALYPEAGLGLRRPTTLKLVSSKGKG